LTTEEELGGVVGEATISSYHLEWDAGTVAAGETEQWSELAGLSSAYLATSFTAGAPA
jgi:hypothetical protein